MMLSIYLFMCLLAFCISSLGNIQILLKTLAQKVAKLTLWFLDGCPIFTRTTQFLKLLRSIPKASSIYDLNNHLKFPSFPRFKTFHSPIHDIAYSSLSQIPNKARTLNKYLLNDWSSISHLFDHLSALNSQVWPHSQYIKILHLTHHSILQGHRKS